MGILQSSFGVIALVLISPCVWAQDYQLREGILPKSEIWDKPTILTGDTVVPQNGLLTLAPGAWVIINDHDNHNLGQNPDLPELIVNGQLQLPPNTDEVKLYSIHNPRVQALLNQGEYMTLQPQTL